jgi:hypothetical protein
MAEKKPKCPICGRQAVRITKTDEFEARIGIQTEYYCFCGEHTFGMVRQGVRRKWVRQLCPLSLKSHAVITILYPDTEKMMNRESFRKEVR